MAKLLDFNFKPHITNKSFHGLCKLILAISQDHKNASLDLLNQPSETTETG